MFKHMFRMGEARLVYFSNPEGFKKEGPDTAKPEGESATPESSKDIEGARGERKTVADKFAENLGKQVDAANKLLEGAIKSGGNVVKKGAGEGIKVVPGMGGKLVKKGDVPSAPSTDIPLPGKTEAVTPKPGGADTDGSSTPRTETPTDTPDTPISSVKKGVVVNADINVAAAQAEASATAIGRGGNALAQGGSVFINNAPEKAERINEAQDRALLNTVWQQYRGALLTASQKPNITLPEMKTEQIKLVADMTAKLEGRESHFAVRLMNGNPNFLPNPVLYQKEPFNVAGEIQLPEMNGLTVRQMETLTIIFNQNLNPDGSIKNMKTLVSRLNYESAKGKMPIEWIAGQGELPPMPQYKNRNLPPAPRAPQADRVKAPVTKIAQNQTSGAPKEDHAPESTPEEPRTPETK